MNTQLFSFFFFFNLEVTKTKPEVHFQKEGMNTQYLGHIHGKDVEFNVIILEEA
jgi:hypothetical protein